MQYFLEYDSDLDHLLSEEEFGQFVDWLMPNVPKEERKKVFGSFDDNKDGMVEYNEFKIHFHEAMKFTRMRNLAKELEDISKKEEST